VARLPDRAAGRRTSTLERPPRPESRTAPIAGHCLARIRARGKRHAEIDASVPFGAAPVELRNAFVALR
jgi:hypothetical protein